MLYFCRLWLRHYRPRAIVPVSIGHHRIFRNLIFLLTVLQSNGIHIRCNYFKIFWKILQFSCYFSRIVDYSAWTSFAFLLRVLNDHARVFDIYNWRILLLRVGYRKHVRTADAEKRHLVLDAHMPWNVRCWRVNWAHFSFHLWNLQFYGYGCAYCYISPLLLLSKITLRSRKG